jgi:alcohol dehydrogenase class IV
MRFEFATANNILFGAGTLNEVGKLVAGMGKRALVLTTPTPGRAARLFDLLGKQNLTSTTFAVDKEPSVELVLKGIAHVRENQSDMVISIGGGSTIDAGKAIAALSTNPGDPLDYMEVIGRGKAISVAPLPFIAIPTTAGTGAEVTRNAVLASPEHRVKVSVRSPLMLARLAVVDPELTYDLPPEITASTGLDALTQVLEPYVSINANPLTDAVALEGLRRAARSLRRAYEQGSDPAAREDMALASLFGGLALANAKLGAVHGFAGPLGGMFPAPHGAVCACLLPHVMTINVRALRQRQPDSPILRRYEEVARIVTGNPQASIDDGIMWVRNLSAALHIPPLSAYGVQPADFPTLVEKSAVSSSMKGNPIALTTDEMTEILSLAV